MSVNLQAILLVLFVCVGNGFAEETPDAAWNHIEPSFKVPKRAEILADWTEMLGQWPPLITEPKDQLDNEKLKREFFQGGRVLTEHVAASLDVPRIEALQEIHKLFQQEDIVILRAASGQGKTTLAYRYLLDWAPTDFRYEVLQAADFQHARRMSAAIAGHAEVIDVPTMIYVDVRPGDSLWVEFVRELAAVSGVRVLVTERHCARIAGSRIPPVGLQGITGPARRGGGENDHQRSYRIIDTHAGSTPRVT